MLATTPAVLEQPGLGTWLASLGEAAPVPAEHAPTPDGTKQVVVNSAGRTLRLLARPGQALLSLKEAAACGLVFDGWLYNREELRHQLASPAHASDAELTLQAYLRWGEDVLHKLKGIFSLCIWDGRRGTLLCARDPAGVYPLFYVRLGREWLFSTSTDTLLEHPRVPHTINRGAIVAHLWMRGRDIEETFFSAIRRLPPGHALKVQEAHGDPIIYRYWNPIPAEGVSWIQEDELERFGELMKQAIGRCSQLGRPGIFLSGGLDSGTIATFAAQFCQEAHLPPPRAFSLVFSDPEANEEHFQKGIAKGLGIPQTLVPVNLTADPVETFFASLKLNATWPNPLPGTFSSLYLALAKRAKEEGCGCILSGEGGDEWLTIHDTLSADFIRTRNLPALWQLWQTVQKTQHASWYGTTRHVLWSHGLRPLLFDTAGSVLRRVAPNVLQARRQRLLKRDIPAWLAPDPELRRQLLERAEPSFEDTRTSFYQRDVRDHILDQPLTVLYMEEEFENSRRVGVPILQPFYDPDVVEFLVRTPPQLRSQGGRYKGMLRRILHQRFPHLGYDRQVKPYATNFLGAMVLEGLREAWPKVKRIEALTDLGVVDGRVVDNALTNVLRQERLFNPKDVWLVLCSEVWVRSRLARLGVWNDCFERGGEQT